MVYRIYGRFVSSTIDLPELPAASGEPDLDVRAVRLPPAGGAWSDVWPAVDGGPWVRSQRSACGYRIRYEAQAEFAFVPGTRTLLVDVQDSPAATVRHFLLDQVIPLVLSLDSLVLHASACLVDGVMAAFAGPGGAGKSTLAAVLGRRGHAICADDGLLIRATARMATGAPAYPGLRLWPEIATAMAPPGTVAASPRKQRLTEGWQFETAASPMGCIYVLDPAPAASIAIAPLSARDTAMAMLEHSYRLEQRDPAALARQMDLACEAAGVLCGWRLAYPRSRSAWPDVARALVAHVRGRAVRSCSS